jgi:hypothetical protein
MLSRDDHGFIDLSARALNAAIDRSILAEPATCFVMMTELHSAQLRRALDQTRPVRLSPIRTTNSEP